MTADAGDETDDALADAPPDVPARVVVAPGRSAFGPAIARFDRWADIALERVRGNPVADTVMTSATALGDFSLIWHIVNVSRGLTGGRRADQVPVLALAIGAESLIVNQGLKRLFRRPRPTVEGDPRYPVRRPQTSSFPSGHASAAAFTAVLLTTWDGKRSAPLWWTLASRRRRQPRLRAHPPRLRRRRRHGHRRRPRPRRPPDPAPNGNRRRHASVDEAMTRAFGLTYDYRCPFARIVHDHVVTALRAGADWEVTWLPFSLGQAHVAEGEPSVWERPESDTGLLALQASIAVRDTQPERFVDAHHALFEHRHASAGAIAGRDDLTPVLESAGVDVDAVWAEVDSGRPLATVEKEHTAYVDSHSVWGVPTFIVDDSAVFVRLLDLPQGDAGVATESIERILDQIELVVAQRVQAHVDSPLTSRAAAR